MNENEKRVFPGKDFPCRMNSNVFYIGTSLYILSYRLTRIDESVSILSDISYDKTDDSIVSTFHAPFKKFSSGKLSPNPYLLCSGQDWDSSKMRTVRLKRREKRVNKPLLGRPSSATCFRDV